MNNVRDIFYQKENSILDANRRCPKFFSRQMTLENRHRLVEFVVDVFEGVSESKIGSGRYIDKLYKRIINIKKGPEAL